MSGDVQLRAYGQEDFDWLVELHRVHYREVDGFDDTFAPLVASILRAFQDEHDPACERGWIAERDGVPVGSIFCVRLDEGTAKLRLFLLAPEARGQGVGTQLLTACMGFARDMGYRKMQLWTHESHTAACALYRKFGWTCTSSKPVHSFGVDLVEQAWEIAL
ncbi:GNAT family N-acetyltransferase [Marivita hallyeonensis]|uniref:Ribosomal protein S18 acetylase RimI n=1 Tax=Marivita hallyeonensis TaxID=996342 RepID=A0A1M5PCX5_9RHOB|nr:GNAT family N-acetyltransferase [Marivita hallyeonensis]SHG99636.1 Ribosomal protein S18 acetylase RimI [Marivita hallyeonensis]